MTTNLSIRNLPLRKLIRTVLLLTLALLVGLAAQHVYTRLTTNTIVAYFPDTLALYEGDAVQIMGVKVGAIDSIEPAGDKMRVTFHYKNKYKVPANANASVLNPSLVASRVIQLSPPYEGGPILRNNDVIPVERTRVPVEYDELRDSISRVLTDLGPTPQQPKGPFGDLIESFADGLQGKGQQINTTLNSLSDALNALNVGRGDFFGVVRSLAQFINALYKNDQRFTALNKDLAEFSSSFTHTDHDLSAALQDVEQLLTTTRKFIDDNGGVLTKDLDNLAQVTNAILQPEPRKNLERLLHVGPNIGANTAAIYAPAQGALTAAPAIVNFANPLQFMCSSVQAASRLGFQDSAELCAQYLTPVLDAIKFNYLPIGELPFSTAMVLPKMVSYSEDRLQPPPGYKDTTVPGIFSPDTLLSHGNHEPGWVVAPGMQGTDVQTLTANMLTPDSLAELLGGPDVGLIPPRGPRGAAPANSYDQINPPPAPFYTNPNPLPDQPPGVIQEAPLGAAGGQP
ncbi:MAG: mammalian cell entry protein [Mycobacterium sp.]|nr:MAG: mammalian cell entry protein [Mycobacterium sp.]PJE24703.1 MAG: mammalian cell entry protein [Mycobacterium sp.]